MKPEHFKQKTQMENVQMKKQGHVPVSSFPVSEKYPALFKVTLMVQTKYLFFELRGFTYQGIIIIWSLAGLKIN